MFETRPVDEFNIAEICRLCRSSNGVMSYIFRGVGLDASTPLSTRVMRLANIHMHEGDGLPSLICHRCLFYVEQFTEFKILCEQSDSLLREQLNRNHSNEENEEELLEEECDSKVGIIGTQTSRSDDEVSNDDVSDSDASENYLHCPTCNKRFISKDALERHNFIHTQDGPFPCDYCEATTPDKATLRVHWRQAHSGNKAHMCQTCGASYSCRENLVKHTARHDKYKPYRCDEPECSKAFAYRSDLRKHSVIHSGLRPYVCPVCCKAFTRSTNLNKHARVHNGSKPFPCGECDKMFATRGDLMRHSMIHTGEKPYACSVCFVSFNRKDKLARHEKLHSEQRAHVCQECPTSFNRKEDLTKHIQFHHYSSICGDFTTIEMPRLSENNEVKSEPDSESNNDDTEDVVISVDPQSWTDMKIACDSCHKTFKDIDHLSRHMPCVVKTRDFICGTCHKGFYHRRELARHTLTHTGYRPFECTLCDKAFARRDKLTRHMKTHGNKPVAARPNVNTSVHTRRDRDPMYDSQREVYCCNVCSVTCTKKVDLIAHIKTDH